MSPPSLSSPRSPNANENQVVVFVVGEGKTDLGVVCPAPTRPDTGVAPVLLAKLCGNPSNLRVVSQKIPTLYQGSGFARKVKFILRDVLGRPNIAAVVLIFDSEGKLKEKVREMETVLRTIQFGKPFVVGFAHPCIESWLLVDSNAIVQGMKIPRLCGDLPDDPEKLPAPCDDRNNNPKRVLRKVACESNKRELSVEQKTAIASKISDLNLLCNRLPQGFGPFAKQVQAEIAKLFQN